MQISKKTFLIFINIIFFISTSNISAANFKKTFIRERKGDFSKKKGKEKEKKKLARREKDRSCCKE